MHFDCLVLSTLMVVKSLQLDCEKGVGVWHLKGVGVWHLKE